MYRLPLLLVMLALLLVPSMAQADDLITEDLRLDVEVDIFGVEQAILRGRIFNTGDVPYAIMDVLVDALDEDGAFIGEGYGYAVDACGGALFDVPLQPQRHFDFFATLELDDTPDNVADWVVTFQTEAMPDALAIMPELPDGIEMITDAEVVIVEWLDETILRYGVGCDGQLVTRHDWYTYNLIDGGVIALDIYPNAEFVTDEFIQRSEVNILTQGQIPDETLIERSYLTFPTQSNRVVWQDDIHNVFTSERDGNFKRAVHPRLSIYSLQGFIFSPTGNFVAYYFGAYGEPVRWFTAGMGGTLISTLIGNNPVSNTVPGLTNDAQRVIISGDYEEGLGYYLQSANNRNVRQFLFNVDALAGNNYPAPVYRLVNSDTRYIYIIRPDADETVLECYHLEANSLSRLTALPFTLNEGERAWAWLSPSGEQLAIGANGRTGGAWIVDLSAFDACS